MSTSGFVHVHILSTLPRSHSASVNGLFMHLWCGFVKGLYGKQTHFCHTDRWKSRTPLSVNIREKQAAGINGSTEICFKLVSIAGTWSLNISWNNPCVNLINHFDRVSYCSWIATDCQLLLSPRSSNNPADLFLKLTGEVLCAGRPGPCETVRQTVWSIIHMNPF